MFTNEEEKTQYILQYQEIFLISVIIHVRRTHSQTQALIAWESAQKIVSLHSILSSEVNGRAIVSACSAFLYY